MRNVSALTLGIALLALGGCAPQSESIPEETLAAWEKAYNAGDAAGVAAIYTADATVMAPGVPAMKGRDAIEKFMKDGFAQGATQMSIATDESFVRGDTSVRRGTYRVTTSDGALVEAGKYVEIWKNNGGKWELCMDIWNSDAPPPAPAAAPAAAPAETPPPAAS